MVTRSRIALLGGLRIEQGERIISRFRTQKTGALLAYLAYYRERSHPREQLIDILWPEADLEAGRNGLSRELSSLRHQLEPPGVPHGAILRANRFSVQLNPEAVSTDVAEFEAARQKAAQARSTSERLLFLADAVELYTGELLPGYYEAWCLAERGHVGETYLGLLRQLVELLDRAGDLERALGYARRAVSADPLREESYQGLMRLLVAAGQPTAALRQCRELEQRLDEELGEQPSAATRQLALEIERQATGHAATQRRAEEAIASASERVSALPSRLPTGTVTFLLTDIERSTAQWERAGDAFATALASHHTLLRRLFRRYGGYEFKEAGEGFLVAFERAGDALACAIAGQQALAEHPWGAEVGPLQVRMALHTGDVELQGGDYRGLVLHHASRMLAAAHGGQILCSDTTAALVQRQLEPGIRLSDLGVYRLRDVQTRERLFQVQYPGMASSVFPPPRADGGYGRTLPLQFTRFIGREKELGQLEELLLAEPTRPVTMTGPGGTGKSRLALELASRLLERFGGAVWFVPLADLSDARQIADAALEALHLPRLASAEPLDQVIELLSRQPSLLILDNFEHLVAEGASFVRTLLERVPSLQCLVTSRQRLELAGEREFVVPPLQIPAGGDTLAQLSMSESVQLFIDRAQAVKPDFQVTNQNAPALAELCSRLEGIPLAIELAAARAQVLTPAQMLRQLTHRFEFLVSRRRDGAPRHQTLHAAVEWSCRLLSPELQQFFARLSVFRGGWSLEAAEAVCEEPMALDYLAQLRECSLILTEEDGDQTRFRMLETLREFAHERLEASGEAAALRRQHADFFIALAEEAGPLLGGPDYQRWRRRLTQDHDNLRVALTWCSEEADRATAGLRLAGSLPQYWILQGYFSEGREHLNVMLSRAGAADRTEVHAVALDGAGHLACGQGDYAAARSYYAESTAIWQELGYRLGEAMSLRHLGDVQESLGDYREAHSYYEQALAISRDINDRVEQRTNLERIGNVARAQADYFRARSCYEQALAISREVRGPWIEVFSLCRLGNLAAEQADYSRARSCYEQALAISRRVGCRLTEADILSNMGYAGMEEADYEEARSFYCRALDIYREINHWRGEADVLAELGLLTARQGNHSQARSYSEQSLAIHREKGDRGSEAWSLNSLGSVAKARGDYALARSCHERALEINRDMGSRSGQAASLMKLGLVIGEQGDASQAHSFLTQALSIWFSVGATKEVAEALEALASIAASQQRIRRAVRLNGSAAALRASIAAPIPPRAQETHERGVAAVRAALGEEEFNAAWAEGKAMPLEDAVRYALEEQPPE